MQNVLYVVVTRGGVIVMPVNLRHWEASPDGPLFSLTEVLVTCSCHILDTIYECNIFYGWFLKVFYFFALRLPSYTFPSSRVFLGQWKGRAWKRNANKQTISEILDSKEDGFQEKFKKANWAKVRKEPGEWKLDKQEKQRSQRKSGYEGSPEKKFWHTWNESSWRSKVSKHVKKKPHQNQCSQL